MCVSHRCLHVFLLTEITSHHEKHTVLHQESDSQTKVSTQVSQVKADLDKCVPNRPTVVCIHFKNNNNKILFIQHISISGKMFHIR